MPLRIHVLQHVEFEDEANIAAWCRENRHAVTRTALYRDEKLPSADSFDWLIAMGGPMSVNDEREFSWLVREKTLIGEAIDQGKAVLGVCLGAQLIANVLGARVYKNPYKEIGWHEVFLTEGFGSSSVFGALPIKFTAFHWHGETFDLPPGCTRMARSEACSNQAFEYKDRVIGLQFHLESSEESIRRLIQNCPEDLVEGKYAQSAGQILPGTKNLSCMQDLLFRALDRLQRLQGSIQKSSKGMV